MTVSPHADIRPAEQSGGDYDVVIIGAGISGIGAAYRLAESDPSTRYVILERRERIGGTWDLFRYPGVRSDSSIFSLSWPWEPWTGQENVADGDQIRDYIEDAARRHGIYPHIRFHTTVNSADWDSTTDTWTVHATENGVATNYRGRFVFFGSGYYNYDAPYTPEFPGIESYRGQVVHAQHWPDDLDCTGKKVVVIGSGATAVSLVPALARKAGHVTMLQRSPGYLFSMPRISAWMPPIQKYLPGKASYNTLRGIALMFEKVIWALSRGTPGVMKKIVRWQNTKLLPANYPVERDFKPRYNPWDQRMCLVADGDMFGAIKDGSVDVVTDHVDHFDATGIALKSGRHLDADVVIAATGLNLLALGGVQIRVDGTEVKPQDRFSYKAHMLEDVPNLIWCIGYTNASWTLRADITARATAKLVNHMKTHGYTHAYPHPGAGPMPETPTWDLQAGYVLRNAHALPKSSARRPWVVRQNFFADAFDYRFLDKIDEDMVFGQVAKPAELAAASPNSP
jgi:cation diffusion facilitator CzcD-associated flavoprotein CzcO